MAVYDSKYNGAELDGAIDDALSHIQNNNIHVTSTEKQTWNNKQKPIQEGRGITVTTGADADTVSLNLPIYAGSGTNSIAEGSGTTASGESSHAEGESSRASGYSSHAEGYGTTARGDYSHAEGLSTAAIGTYSHAEGGETEASGSCSHAEGNNTIASNESEHASGRYNVSNRASTTFGDGGNTLFSVGNGTADNAKHNAFEIRQNGDIYITNGGQDVKLQEILGNKVDKTTTVNGHALSGNVTVTASDVGLGNVGNFKAVSTEANQNLTETEKSDARNNLGLGSMATKSSLYEIGACANNDSRLSDKRFPKNMFVRVLTIFSDISITNIIATHLPDINVELSTITFIYENSDTEDHVVTVATTITVGEDSCTVHTPDGNPIELTCPAGGYCEVNFVRRLNDLYARGI